MKHRQLPEQATHCLTCACRNGENAAATELMADAEALTATGVIAAIFLADSEVHHDLTMQAREAIREQREWCEAKGTFREDCPLHRSR
jgi:hypothetical protein